MYIFFLQRAAQPQMLSVRNGQAGDSRRVHLLAIAAGSIVEEDRFDLSRRRASHGDIGARSTDVRSRVGGRLLEHDILRERRDTIADANAASTAHRHRNDR